MRILSAEMLAFVGLLSMIACGGSTARGTTDSGLHDEDSGASRDGATPHPDTGLPEERNDGGIVNDATPGVCPATYAIAGSAGNCGTADVLCIYDEGTCTCGEPGPPHEGPSDWFCTPLTTGCPYAPPSENSACSGAGLYCDYGACSGGTAWDCTGGVWTQGAAGCPQ